MFILFSSLLGFTFGTATVGAETAQNTVCNAINGTSCDDATAPADLTTLIRTIVQILSVVAGAIAIVMIIISGFKYITSGGEASKVAAAKNALVFAIIGLIIVALSQLMVRFVLSQSKNVTNPVVVEEEQVQ